MIRTGDFTFNPSIKFSSQPLGVGQSESEWKASLRFLDEAGGVFNKISRGAALVDKVAHLKPLRPVAAPIKALMESLGSASQLANIYLSTEAFTVLAQEGKLGLNLQTAKEVLTVTESGIELAQWLGEIQKLGAAFRVIGSLSSMGLGLALLSPTLDLIIHLREEGWRALSGAQCYKTSYQVGLSLLAIYLFMTSVTLSFYLSLLIQSTTFAVSYL